jgi:GNAT superfamily N-acetyltransferase
LDLTRNHLAAAGAACYNPSMFTTRALTIDDIDLICRHRQEMFREAGRQAELLEAMAAPFRDWLEARLADERYFGFITEQDGRAIGGIGLMVIDWPPHPSHPLDDRRGYVLNLYVEPVHRGRGVARGLMEAAELRFAEIGLRYVILHATELGRPLYEQSGWLRTTEMAKSLPLLRASLSSKAAPS